MKYLALLISIYFTVMAVLPCHDDEHITASNSQVTIQKLQPNSQEHSQETCPPFCNCSCCSNARQLVSKSILTIFRPAIICAYPEYAVPATQNQIIAIWQPPQII